MKRKILASILSIAVICTTSVNVMAQEPISNHRAVVENLCNSVSSETIDKDIKAQMRRDMQLFEDSGILISDISGIILPNEINTVAETVLDTLSISESNAITTYGTASNENIIYRFENDMETDLATIQENNDGSITLNITTEDGSKSDVVTLDTDGSIYLDGNKVTYSETIYSDENGDIKDNFDVVARDVQSWTQEGCPYGTTRDYSQGAGTESSTHIGLGKSLNGLTALAIATIIGVFSFVLGLAYSVAVVLTDSFASASPTSQYLSYKAYKYYHKDANSSGYISAMMRYVTEYYTTWYSEANYRGTSEQFVSYYCLERY